MNASYPRQFLACLLTLTILLYSLPAGVFAEDSLPLPEETAETAPPETTVPVPLSTEEPPVSESTEPTQPEKAVTTETEPLETQPEETLPEETGSADPLPAETVAEETLPEETEAGKIQPEETAPEESSPEEVPEEPVQEISVPAANAVSAPPEQELYFGRLHAHTELSSGTESLEEVFSNAATVEGMDFFAVTDHSESLEGHKQSQICADGSTISADWAAGKAAAAAATCDTFVGIFGYEMSWPRNMQIGHISTFNTPGFQSWQQDSFKKYNSALKNYYTALASQSGSVSQFNHPGTEFGTFCDFGHYSPEADNAVTLLEVGSGKDAFRYYIKALDAGWHLAPTNSQSGSNARTVVCAKALTEKSLYDAMKNYRVYTTEDADLEILYSMDGHFMGSSLDLRHIGQQIDISVTLSDPSDSTLGLVEVITKGGTAAAKETLSSAAGTLTFALPPQSGYYFLRITQPDGDAAVTAPIWVDAEDALGISGLRCETAVPVQNEPISLSLELYNQETADFLVDSVELLADGEALEMETDLTRIPASSTLTHHLSFRCSSVGQTELTLRLSGTLEGSPRTYEAPLTLSFRQSPQVTGILVDGSHGNIGLDRLTILKDMATEEHIRLTIASTEITADDLTDCRFLLIPAPSEPFSMQFLGTVADYTAYGGSLILCGQADSLDQSLQSAAELNRLLAAIGSSLRLRDDLARDTVTNGGSPELLYPDTINRSASFLETITKNQVFRFSSGCTVDPGSGAWLVKGFSTTESVDADNDGHGGSDAKGPVLLACETLPGGGTAFAAGSLFLSDENMAQPGNIWEEPYANRTIGQNLLGIGGEALPLSPIGDLRQAETGTLVRIRGYVTAGTSNPYNTFPDTLYLQDDTGAIAVMPFTDSGIQTGMPLEFSGTLEQRSGNLVLKLISSTTLNAAMYQYQPRQGSWKTLLDPAANDNLLVEIEGTCLEVYCREDGTLAGCLLKDDKGRQAQVEIEDQIGSSSDGSNDLHKSIRKGRTVRAAGLLHINELGDTVIRVRNCEEVVYVPPRKVLYLNPKTGDFLLPAAAAAMAGSLAGLLLLKKRKKP